MRNIRRNLTLAGAALALAVTASGCVGTDRTESTQTNAGCPWKPDESITSEVTIAWQPIPNGDLIVQDRGILEACMPNASIEWKQFSSGGDAVQAFSTGDIDVGLLGSAPATTALSPPNNMPISVVWIADVIGAAESLVAFDPAVKTIEDLRGKTVAVPFGSTAHYSLLQALSDADMSQSDIDLVNLEPENMLAVWGTDIDAAWVWNPALSDLMAKQGHLVMTAEDTAKIGYPTFDLIAARTAFVKENRAFMGQWAKAQDWAIDQIKNDPGKSAESIAVLLGTESVQEAKDLMQGYTYLNAPEQTGQKYLGGQMGEDLATTAKFLLQQGAIGKVLPPSTYESSVDTGPGEEASQ